MSGVGSTEPPGSGGAGFAGAGSGIKDWFAGPVAERYDEETADMPVEPVVDFLAGLAGEGAALELAIGTGRIAVPLAARGVPVQGIDLSPDMVAQLRKKAELPVAIGDYATTRVDGTFSLVYLVFNSIINQTTQEGQVASFQNAAAHLEPGGCFVIEVGVPNRQRLSVFDLSEAHVGVDEYDPATQHSVSHHFTLVEGRWERLSLPFRSVYPAELDLMARLAGMRLRERWGDWDRSPFTSESAKHVSVWEKA
ncbi:MAG: class I SAM-dependent DNA methyltransferase [Gaiellaceae bacterium]